MTLTIPFRLITLHLSHIFFTEGRTFIRDSWTLFPLEFWVKLSQVWWCISNQQSKKQWFLFRLFFTQLYKRG